MVDILLTPDTSWVFCKRSYTMAKLTEKGAKKAKDTPVASTSKLPVAKAVPAVLAKSASEDEESVESADEQTTELSESAQAQDDAAVESGEASEAEMEQAEQEEQTFKSLGVIEPLCLACEQLGFKKPTDIQAQSIPYALQDRDIIGLAQTGSGKTAAFALPIIQALWENPQPLFACVLAPTRLVLHPAVPHPADFGLSTENWPTRFQSNSPL